MTQTITGVAAVARNGVIGADGKLPWHIPADMAHFKEVTMGGALIMGRRTFESLKKPLSGRLSIVVSHRATPAGSDPSVVWVPSIGDALLAAQDSGRPVFVIGGGQIFAEAWPLLTDLELTLVDATPDGDTHLPSFEGPDWVAVSLKISDGVVFAHYGRPQLRAT